MSSILQWGSSSPFISKKDFEDNLIKFLYPFKSLANKGILPILSLYLILIWVPMIGCALDFAIVSENSKAPIWKNRKFSFFFSKNGNFPMHPPLNSWNLQRVPPYKICRNVLQIFRFFRKSTKPCEKTYPTPTFHAEFDFNIHWPKKCIFGRLLGLADFRGEGRHGYLPLSTGSLHTKQK